MKVLRFGFAGLALVLSACAGNPPANKATADKSTAEAESRCPKETGSHIRREGESCSHPGRVVTREEIERTGSTNVGDALRKTDPSIR